MDNANANLPRGGAQTYQVMIPEVYCVFMEQEEPGLWASERVGIVIPKQDDYGPYTQHNAIVKQEFHVDYALPEKKQVLIAPP